MRVPIAPRRRLRLRLLLLLLPALLSCRAPALRGGQRQEPRQVARLVSSNVLREDYVGSAACAKCHGDLYDLWVRSPMHNMTRLPAQAAVQAPFDDAVFHFKDDLVRLSQRGGERFVRIESRRFGDRLFRVTKVIGGHHREDYAGLEVAAAEPGAAVVGDPHAERVLPVSFVIPTRSFRYKGYSVMSPERPGLRPGGAWSRTCIFCHNTVPYLSTILGALAGPKTPPYQGEVVDPLLPEALRAQYLVTDAEGLKRALGREMALLRAGAPAADRPVEEALRLAVRATRAGFREGHLIEVGIGCESCHGGSKEHTQDFRKKPSLAPRSPLIQVVPPPGRAGARAEQINRTCARCHQVLFTRYPYTWEGGLRAIAPGGSNINSGEARDLLLGACASQLSCVACHDPHTHDNQARMEELDRGGGREVCAGCHKKLASDEAVRAHSHHAPGGAGGQCMGCHMPRKNMSLDNRLTRYHRIGSPTDEAKVLGDRPLECALCHADKTVEALLGDMERLFGKRYDRAALGKLYGDLGQNALLATLARGKPHEQAVAVAVLGAERRRDAAGLIAQQLVHPLPIIRYYAQRALEEVLGQPAPFELHQDNERILQGAEGWLKAAGLRMGTAAGPAAPALAPGAEEE